MLLGRPALAEDGGFVIGAYSRVEEYCRAGS